MDFIKKMDKNTKNLRQKNCLYPLIFLKNMVKYVDKVYPLEQGFMCFVGAHCMCPIFLDNFMVW